MNDLGVWARSFGIDLTSGQLDQFRAYESLLIEWNRRISLTAIREPRDIRIRHFLDSLTCTIVTGNLNGLAFIDVGTGAGFPGLPLKILYPESQLTLLESVGKKTKFLEIVIKELSLKNVTIITGRAEDTGHNPGHREQYDWAVARAVAELRVLAEYLLPLVRPGGYILAQKGESAANEIAAAQSAIIRCGGGKVSLTAVHLPETAQSHYLVVIDKIQPTGPALPRRTGIPSKRPL